MRKYIFQVKMVGGRTLPLVVAMVLVTVGVSLGAVAGEVAATRPTTAATTLPTMELQGAFQGGGRLLGQAPALFSMRPEPTGHSPALKVRWTYLANTAERAAIEASPVIVGQTVYVGDTKTSLHALDLVSGKLRWKYDAGDGFAVSPLVVDGKVLAGDLSGVFHAISAADGRKLWTVDVEAAVHSSANLAGNTVIFGTDAADMICLNIADGKVVWKQKGGDRVNSAPSIADGLAYFSGCDAQLRAVEVGSGQEKFAVELGGVAPGSPVLVGDKAVVGTDQGRVVCVGLNPPKQLWVYEGVEEQQMVYATAAVAAGTVVVGARDRQVHGIDLETGKKRWTFSTRGEVNAAPMISQGRVYIGSRDKKLYVLDLKTGASLWEFNAGRPIEGGVAIGQGVLVIGDTGGNVICLEPVK